MPATKIDLKRELKELYAPGRDPAIVDVPELAFLMIDGCGDPNTAPEYLAAVEALYSVSYTLKFAIRRGPDELDYAVMPLEGLWWVPDMWAFSVADKSAWDWTAMIAQPDRINQAMVDDAVAQAARRKPLLAAPKLRLESFAEGLAAQVMHVGPYAAEGPTIERLHAFIAEHGYERAGKHHEIYLGDPRRTDPAKLKTVIRQPVR
jgi:hypothetical protein